MKIINTKYGFIEKNGVKKDFVIKTIEWRNVLSYAMGFAIVIFYLINWYVV